MEGIQCLIDESALIRSIAERRGRNISRKIRPMVVTKKELLALWNALDMEHALLIWGKPIEKA